MGQENPHVDYERKSKCVTLLPWSAVVADDLNDDLEGMGVSISGRGLTSPPVSPGPPHVRKPCLKGIPLLRETFLKS